MRRTALKPARAWRPDCDEVRAALRRGRRRSALGLDRPRARSTPTTSTARAPSRELDPERHYLEGSPEDVAAYLLTLDAINFGSGWFPQLRKRRTDRSGYFTVAWACATTSRAHGAVDAPPSCAR